jgi:putative tryptophan/tyrosine transport system substrate-binding protein
MRRREFITLLGGTASVSWPAMARAQQPARMKRVGFLTGLDDVEARARFAAFSQALAALGWIADRNVDIIARFGTADPGLNQAHVTEIIALAPDVIVASNPISIAASIRATPTIPIVFTLQPDPIAEGFVPSLARPGGNVTGFTSVEPAMAGKWVELLKQVAPAIKRVAMLDDPATPLEGVFAQPFADAAGALAIESIIPRVRDGAEIDRVIGDFARQPNGGLILPPSAGIGAKRAAIIPLAAKYRMPAIYAWRYLAVEGGLMSYGPDVLDLYRRPASYVDRILKGAKPADLPVQQPTKFELVINLKTAKALGLTVPPTLLARADEVIE